MSTRAAQYDADVLRREQLSSHFVRLVLGGPGLAGFTSTGVPDEWVALTVPGQFQTRYYTVRSWAGGELVLDVVVHETGWSPSGPSTDCVGDTVTVSAPKGSFDMPADAAWLLLVGDLTALPAIARIIETSPCRSPRGSRRPTSRSATTSPAARARRHLDDAARGRGDRDGRRRHLDRLARG